MVNYLIRRMNRELRKMKYRAFGSAVLIVLSIFFYIGMAGMVPNTEKALDDKIEELKLNDYMVHVNSANESDTEGLAAIPGVEDVDYRLQVSSRVGYGRDGDGDEKDAAALLYGIDPKREPKVNIPEIMEGEDNDGGAGWHFQGNGTETDGTAQVLLERNFAGNAGVDVGDILRLNVGNSSLEMKVIGLVLTPEHIMLPSNPNSLLPYPGNLAVIFAPIDWLRDAMDFHEDFVNEFCFLFRDDLSSLGKDRESLQNEINVVLEPDIIIYSIPKEQVYGYALVKEDLAQGESSAALFAGIILLVAFFIVYVSFVRLVNEQRKEIGILRALGYSRNAVLGSYLYMALVIGSMSSLVGIIIGIPFSKFMGEFYVELMMGTSMSGFQLPVWPIIVGAIFGPVTACLASGIAAWSTVTMEPQDAIRGTPRSELMKNTRLGRMMQKRLQKNAIRKAVHATPAGTGITGFGIKNRIAGKLKGRYIFHYTFRGMSRNRLRTVLTTVAVALSILIGALPLLMWESILNSMDESIEEYEKWDVLVEYAYPLEQEEADNVSSVHIIESTYISRIQGSWEEKDGDIEDGGAALIAGIQWGQKLHLYNKQSGRLATDSDEIMVNEGMAKEKGIRPGDILVLRAVNGELELEVSALVSDVIGEIYVDMEVIQVLAGEKLYSGMYARTTDGNEKVARDELRASPLVSEAVTRDGTQSGILDLMESSADLIYIFSLMGVGIAAAALANTIFISVLERYSEFGQLRAIGYSRREIARGIIAEIAAIVALGAVVGAPLTYLTLKIYEKEFEAFFPMYRTILNLADWWGYGMVVVLTFVLAIVAAIPSIRLVNRMDVAKTVSGARFG